MTIGFFLHFHFETGVRRTAGAWPVQQRTLRADRALQLTSTMQSSKWNIPVLLQPHSLHPNRLVPVLNLEEEAHCAHTEELEVIKVYFHQMRMVYPL